MKVKIAILSAVLVASAAGVQAQKNTATAPLGSTTYGIHAGVNWQNLNNKDISSKLATKFNIGVNAEVPVATDFYFQPGLSFATKGAKYNSAYNPRINISYLELPLHFLYKPMLGTGKLMLGVGPYLAYAVGGKVKSDQGDATIKFKNSVTQAELASGTPYLKRFDAGADFLFGYEFASRWSAQFNAQLGLVNINPSVSGGTSPSSTKNTGFGVSVGYRF